MEKINPAKCYHIKLGRGSEWSEKAIKKNRIYLGFQEIPPDVCLRRNEDIIKKRVIQAYNGKSPTSRTNAIMHFYDPSEDILWITFFGGCLHYGFAKSPVDVEEFINSEGKSETLKYRELKGKWSYKNVKDTPLYESNLRGDLLSKKYYQGTICEVKLGLLKYLIRKINGETGEIERKIIQAHRDLPELIRGLNPKDFELLVDLVLERSGFQRESFIGGPQKDIDYAGRHPLLNRNIVVQVKSRTDRKEVRRYLKNFREYNRRNPSTLFYFFINEPNQYSDVVNSLIKTPENSHFEIKDISDVSQLVVNLGLITWVLNRS
ncbi:MAG: hypothetical protein KAT65_24820 [Methanophagales archaeon]|nr:hypothetical protein [Methanophagales archaeon]